MYERRRRLGWKKPQQNKLRLFPGRGRKRLFVFKTLNNLFYHLLNLMPTRLKLNFIEK